MAFVSWDVGYVYMCTFFCIIIVTHVYFGFLSDIGNNWLAIWETGLVLISEDGNSNNSKFKQFGCHHMY